MGDKGEKRAKAVLLGSILLSLLAHGGASGVLAMLPSTSQALAAIHARIVEFEVEPEVVPLGLPEPERAEPEPAAPEPAPELPAPLPATRQPPPQSEATPPQAPEPPAPLAEQVHDFGGQVITASSGAGWATAQGSGEDTTGPIGNPVARTTGRSVAGSAAGEVGGTGSAPAAPRTVNYSRGPRPPAGMSAHLRRFYPSGAHARGIEGSARVLFRVRADGSVDVMSVISETPAGEGFGRACMEALRAAPSFTTALDEQGEPVDSPARPYNCAWTQR